MVNVLDSGWSSSGLSSSGDHCVVFLGKTRELSATFDHTAFRVSMIAPVQKSVNQ